MWEGRTRQRFQGSHLLKCTGNVSTTSWKKKLIVKKKDSTTGEKGDSKKRKGEKSWRIKHTTWRMRWPCKQQVVTSNAGAILVFPLIQPFGSNEFFISWQSVLKTMNYWIVRILQCLSSWSTVCVRIPLLCWSRSKEWPSFWWKSSRTNRNEVGRWFTFLFIVFRSPWDVVEHRLVSFLLVCSILTLTLGLRWILGNIPLEFHWLTTNAQSSVFWCTFDLLQSIFPYNVWLWAEYWIWENQWRVFPVNSVHSMDLIRLLLIIFSVMSIICLIERLFPFLMERKFSEHSFPLKTDVSNVEDTFHVLKNVCFCLLHNFEDWSKIFHTRSFTLCKNGLDF